MAFITLLVIAVGVLSAIALVTVGLVEAPWQLLLLGLVAALYGLQRQSWASEAMAQSLSGSDTADIAATTLPTAAEAAVGETETAEDGLELCYRGIRYRAAKSNPDALAPEPQSEGTYRGQPWRR